VQYDRIVDATTVSLWTAGIAAFAAVIGVLVGQLLQSRREQRNWERQAAEQRRRDAEQREDQRRRDAEQREDQRRHDHQLWEREDRYRFATDKRDIYIGFLSGADKALWSTGNSASLFREEATRLEREGEPPLSDVRHWLQEKSLLASLDDSFTSWGDAYSKLQLLAPARLDSAARELFHGVFGMYIEFMASHDYGRVRERNEHFRLALADVQAMMRADLTEPAPS